ESAYAAIVDRVLHAAGEHGEVVYAVPGSPTVAERTVAMLRQQPVQVELVPGLSFVDLAWSRLGIDSMSGVRVVDARACAIDAHPPRMTDLAVYDSLEDELGDLLFQVVIHSVLAAETGAFTVADVARRVHDKLVHRHPHVFGDVRVDSADDVVTNWEQIKKAE